MAESTGPVETLTIRSGTSYGYCVGYCNQTLELTGPTVVFTKVSFRAPTEYPTITCKSSLTQTEWNVLKAQADLSQLRKQPESIGCPDCADGGAEFLELEQGGERYRVTFEAGKTIPGFDALVTALRAKREALKDCK